MDLLIPITRINNNMGMSFGLDKCDQKVTRRGKLVRTEGIVLPEGKLGDVEDIYKYLGILQANENH